MQAEAEAAAAAAVAFHESDSSPIRISASSLSSLSSSSDAAHATRDGESDDVPPPLLLSGVPVEPLLSEHEANVLLAALVAALLVVPALLLVVPALLVVAALARTARVAAAARCAAARLTRGGTALVRGTARWLERGSWERCSPALGRAAATETRGTPVPAAPSWSNMSSCRMKELPAWLASRSTRSMMFSHSSGCSACSAVGVRVGLCWGWTLGWDWGWGCGWGWGCDQGERRQLGEG